jgi:CRP-like cAMP-binding protein
MLHRLTLQGRSYDELRQLASERRTLAMSRDGHLRTLFLNEAALLDFYAELRAWMDRTPLSEADAQIAVRTSTQSPAFDLAPLLGTLGRRMGLWIADQQALLSIARARNVAKGEMILEEGASRVPLLLLCSGVTRATRTLEDGSQQIVAVGLPGDPLNPGDFVLGRSGISISTFSPALVLSIPVAELHPLLEKRPAIIRGLWRETAWRTSVQREWLIWLGRRPAEARLAHLLCEIAWRSVSSRRDTETVELPLTQRELGDVLGLSTVHVNRVLQQLRNSKLVDFSRGRLVIRDRAGLCQAAEFDPAYLETPEGGVTTEVSRRARSDAPALRE